MADPESLKPPSLQLVDFSFDFPDGTRALEGINLEVPAGDSIAIIGPNGAGKSTLLLCMAGLLRGSGEVFIQGQRLTSENARDLRRKVTLVFQDPDDQLFMPVLGEDVAFGPVNLGLDAAEVKRRVHSALGKVNLLDKINRPPHHMSYGEKRRAAIATALALETDILLLDEPTSNLDPATRQELIQYIGALPSTRVVATHDLELARLLCARCVLLSGGHQIASGLIEEILADLPLLQAHRLIPGELF